MENPFGQNLPGRLCSPAYDACLRKQGLMAYVFGAGEPLLLLHGIGPGAYQCHHEGPVVSVGDLSFLQKVHRRLQSFRPGGFPAVFTGIQRGLGIQKRGELRYPIPLPR